MFTEALNAISASLLPARRIAPVTPPDARPCQWHARLRAQELGAIALTEAVPGDGAAMEALRGAHVRRLTALLSGPADADCARQAAASVHALLSMATWCDASAGDPFRFDPCEIDDAFSETACALAAVLNALRQPLAEISPALPRRIEAELRRRLTLPLASEDAPAVPSMECACLLLCAVLLGEPGESARWTAIRRLSRAIDHALNRLPGDGSLPGGLECASDAAILLMNAAEVLNRATEGRVDLTQHEQVACLADYPLFSHIHAGRFMNPGEHDMAAQLDAESLFRFGRLAGDGPLCDLSAWLLRMGCARPADHALTRLLNRNCAPLLDETYGRVRPFREGFLPDAGLMLMRGFQMCAMMTGGTNTSHADAGNVCLFWKEQPVLVDVGGDARDTSLHSLPVIGGAGQMAPVPAARTEMGAGAEDCTCYTVSLTAAYPESAHLADYQRTLLLGAADAPGIRLMDMMDLLTSAPVDFHFICAAEPVPEKDGMRIGPVTLQWDAPLTATAAPIAGTGLFNLTLHAEPAARHRVVFEFVPN